NPHIFNPRISTHYHPSFHYLTSSLPSLLFFFFNHTPTTEIYTLSLHDALPIYFAQRHRALVERVEQGAGRIGPGEEQTQRRGARSEEHTSELQSRGHLVCRLLLEKKKK